MVLSGVGRNAFFITLSPIGARARGASRRRADFFAAGVKGWCGRRFSYGVGACNTPDQTNRVTSSWIRAFFITLSPIGARARGASRRRADFFAAGVKGWCGRRFSYGVGACNTPDQTNRVTSLVDSRFLHHFVTYRRAREGREPPARRFFCRRGERMVRPPLQLWGRCLQHPRSNQPRDITLSPIGARARGASRRRADFFAAGVKGWCGRRFSYGVGACNTPDQTNRVTSLCHL